MSLYNSWSSCTFFLLFCCCNDVNSPTVGWIKVSLFFILYKTLDISAVCVWVWRCVEKNNKNPSLKKCMVSSTCAIRIPVTIANWCSVPSAPRRLVGAISPTYMGVKPEANPAPPNKTKQWDDETEASCWGSVLRLDWRSGALTTVGPDDQATQDHHFKGAAQLGQTHQTSSDEGKQVVNEHGLPPGKTCTHMN